MKRQFELSEDEVRELEQAQVRCKDGATRTRYLGVRLYGTGYPVEEILKITGYTRISIMNWCQCYRAHGIEGLRDKRVGGNHAYLKPDQIEDLKERVHTYCPAEIFGKGETASLDGRFWTPHDITRGVHQWYGVTYRSPSSYVNLLARCGLSYQRPAKVYKSRSEAKVVEFESQLEKN